MATRVGADVKAPLNADRRSINEIGCGDPQSPSRSPSSEIRLVNGHEKLNRLEKRAAIHLHDQLDGVEVSLAAKAPGEIRRRIGSGVELRTDRTREAKKALAILRGHSQGMFNQVVNRYLVSQIPELLF